MSDTIKKHLPKIRFVLYIMLFFWLAAGCSSQIGVTTKVKKTKTLCETTTGLAASLTLEDLKLTNKPTPTN